MGVLLEAKSLKEFFHLLGKYAEEIDNGTYYVLLGGLLERYNNYESRLETDKKNVELIDKIPKHIQERFINERYNTRKTIIGSLTKHLDILNKLKTHNPNLLSPYNINNPPEILKYFANSQYREDKIAVIMNPATPLDLLLALSYEPNIRIRENIVFNPNATTEIIKNALRDCDQRYFEKNLHIRRALKANKNASNDLKRKATSFETMLSYDCFIATAVYGDKHAIELQILRNYRDAKLCKSKIGRRFIELYYRMSPKISRIVSKNKLLRQIIRLLVLDPIIKLLLKKPI